MTASQETERVNSSSPGARTWQLVPECWYLDVAGAKGDEDVGGNWSYK